MTNQIRTTVQTVDGFIHKYGNNSSGQPIYEGIAEPGTAVGTAEWKLIKYTYDSNGGVTDIQFADGDKNFDNTWSERASKSYS